MAGFPPIDQLYYENPSLRLGGWIAFVLKRLGRGQATLDIVPGRTGYTRIRCHHFPSLSELSQFLRQDHNSTYYYRGQTSRYAVTYRGTIARLAEAFPDLSPLGITFESLLPSLFRQELTADDPDWGTYVYPTPLDTIPSAVRAIAHTDYEPLRVLLSDFLLELRLLAVNNLLIRLGADPRGGLPDRAPLTNVCQKLGQIISLAQHYEFTSSMIDITKDPDAAVWFASHTWSGHTLKLDNTDGVIYRFRNDNDEINLALNKELMAETPAQLAIFSAGLLGLTDISTLSDDFGLRPSRQSGGSLMGLENSIVFQTLDVYDAYEVFTFPLESVSGTETDLSKADLCPENDPVTTIFTRGYADKRHPLTPEELSSLARAVGLSAHDCGILFRARSERLI